MRSTPFCVGRGLAAGRDGECRGWRDAGAAGASSGQDESVTGGARISRARLVPRGAASPPSPGQSWTGTAAALTDTAALIRRKWAAFRR
ncbi:hypothetical protein ACFPES_18290 [Paenibacillus sp. GCM10023248]|uniref:hypothetical protein n=1 Tax=unclassified Paenibacillus TaxID=185978 RepID=UPI00237853C0|nr:hypothetical protein [Paenibacillus sp. MAHUQ-63]MDD9268996.1 hypothetical protein [Paenibacillus sp. MAHUQ-63]